MEVPIGFIATLWSFLSFLPFFFLLLLLGLLKGVIMAPVVGSIIGFGNSAVIIGLWPAHIVWTCYCVAKTKRLGLVLKILAMLLLPVPLVLWPIVGIVCSFLGGVAYGFFAPLLATFEAVGENVTDKFVHCFVSLFSLVKIFFPISGHYVRHRSLFRPTFQCRRLFRQTVSPLANFLGSFPTMVTFPANFPGRATFPVMICGGEDKKLEFCVRIFLS